MTTAEEYWKLARECARWAEAATDEDERQAFLDMGKVWTLLALGISKRGDNPDVLATDKAGDWQESPSG